MDPLSYHQHDELKSPTVCKVGVRTAAAGFGIMRIGLVSAAYQQFLCDGVTHIHSAEPATRVQAKPDHRQTGSSGGMSKLDNE